MLKGRGLPKDRQFDHITSKPSTFSGTVEAMKWNLAARPADIIFKQLPKSLTLSIAVPKMDIRQPFGSQMSAFENVMAAAYRLLPYAKSGCL